MINAIIPLAGPDFVSESKHIKALQSIRGQPLLEYVLKSRPWHQKVRNYIFVLMDGEIQRVFARELLCKWFSDSRIIFIGSDTHGAACSAIAGISCLEPDDTPLVVDLADISYSCYTRVEDIFEYDSSKGGRALVFNSTNPAYSYLLCNDKGHLIRAAEKRVISENASAGTYFFRDQTVFLQAFAHSVTNKATMMHNGLLYVCPLLNGVLAQGLQVDTESVWDVHDIKMGY